MMTILKIINILNYSKTHKTILSCTSDSVIALLTTYAKD